MNLIRIALRICAVEAVRGKTVVGDRVLDSQISALDFDGEGNASTAEDKPFLAVTTERGEHRPNGNSLRDLMSCGTIDLVFEAGVSTGMLITDPETGASEVVPGIGATDASIEYTLDLLFRQIAMAFSEQENEWAQCLNMLIVSVDRIERLRAGNQDDDGKLAAHRMMMRVGVIEDPLPEQALDPEGAFGKFLGLLRESEAIVYQRIADDLQAQISGTTIPHQGVRRDLGMPNDEFRDLGLGPIRGAEDETIHEEITGEVAPINGSEG